MAASAQRAWLLGGDRAPSTPAVGAGRSVEEPSPRAPASPERGRADRVVGRSDRLEPHPGSCGGLHTGASPVDRARAGSKHHLLTDATGVPLSVSLTGGHRNDVTQLLELVDGVGPVRG